MNSNYRAALTAVLKYEGGYVNHPKDPGGATNRGITQKTYDAYRSSKGLQHRSVKLLAEDELQAIYKKQYWDAIHGDDLPHGLDFAVFDFAVNSGPSRAASYLQLAVGATMDGHIGLQTLAKAKTAAPEKAIERLCDARLSFLKGLKTWNTFGKGWERRVSSVRVVALQLTEKATEAPVVVPAPTPAPTPVPAPTQAPKASLWAWIKSLFT